MSTLFTAHAKLSLFNPTPKEDPKALLLYRLNKTEIRSAAFYPISHRFKQVYGDRGLSVQAEGARTLKNHRRLEIWENVEWIYMHGEAHPSGCGIGNTRNKSRIDILNVSLGLKTIGKVFSNWLYLYAGIGPDLGIVFVENTMNCGTSKSKQHKSYLAVGGIFKSGAQVYLTPSFYLSAFADYLYLPVDFHDTIDIGGLKAGGGIGARF